jgi:hypothetical protein
MKKPFHPDPSKLGLKTSLKPQPTTLNIQNIMTYLERLNPWCIIRPVSNVQMRIVGRFRRRADAEGHLQVLQRMMPTVPFEIMFDVPQERTEPEEIPESL